MASWEVHAAEAFEQFPGDGGRDGDLAGHLLVTISGSGRVEDHFRVALTGGDTLSHTLSAADLTGSPSLSHYLLTYEAVPASLNFKANSFTTKWENVEDLVAAERIQASTDEIEDADDTFRAAWAAAKDSRSPPAAAVRWSIQAHDISGLKVVLQGMPGTARALRSDARLTADSGRTIELASWVAATPMAGGSLWTGPMPVLFSEDPGKPVKYKKKLYRRPKKPTILLTKL